MKLKTITLLQQERRKEAGYRQLIRSLEWFGYDYEALNPQPYLGFADKMKYPAAYLETLGTDYTHFLFMDGTDTFALSTPAEVMERYIRLGSDKILMSCEKAFWPRYKPEMEHQYPACETEWKHLNSGSYLAPIDVWLEMWHENRVDAYDDQLWYHERFLSWKYPFALDTHCQIFQSIAHDYDAERNFGQSFDIVDGRLHNRKTDTFPALWHGNGQTPLGWVYKMLP